MRLMKDWKDRFATRLEELTRSKGMTRESLAESLSVTTDTLAQWLSGDRSPATLEEYEKIAIELSMHPAELLYGVRPQQATSQEQIEFVTAYAGLSSNERASVRRLYMRLRNRSSGLDHTVRTQ